MNFVDEWFQAKVQTVVFDLRYFSIDCSHHHTIRIRSKRESQQSFLHQNVVVTWLHKTFFHLPLTVTTNSRIKGQKRMKETGINVHFVPLKSYTQLKILAHNL